MLAKLHDEAGVKGRLWRATASTYDALSSKVRIGAAESNEYAVENGLREGSVLSPTLYTIGMNSLLVKLRMSGHGSVIDGNGDLYCGAVGFVDDIGLIAFCRPWRCNPP